MALTILQGKVLPEVLEQFIAAKEASEATTYNQFMEILLEAYQNPKVKTVQTVKPSDEQAAEVQNLQNEIGRLKTALSLKDDQLEALEETLRNLGEKISNLENVQIVPPVPILKENQLLIDVLPFYIRLIDIERQTAKRKEGIELTREEILLNLFWESIYKGKCYPYKIWSHYELLALEKEVNQQPA